MRKPLVALLALFIAPVVPLEAQAPSATQQPPPPPERMKVEVRPGGPRQQIPMDLERARLLYVPTDPSLQSPGRDYQADIDERLAIEARYAAACKGLIDYQKVSYRSRIGDMDIPAYLFQPLQKRGPKGHAAMIWVHGGVHGNWGITMFPFVKEAVDRGYVIIAPEYRGSIGYGESHHQAIDYGGYEVDDTISAYDHLKTLPHVDPDRVGMMGWSHGGYITLLSVFRDEHPFKAGAAIVPVTNLLYRLSRYGPRYQWDFSTQKRIQGLPFEKPELYIERSPMYHVDKLKVPLLVHVATNDRDVYYDEDQMIVDALRSRKPDLAETKTYVDPDPWGASVGHSFSRRVDAKTLERVESPAQIDSWNRTWVFFEWILRPYEDRSKKAEPVRVREPDRAEGAGRAGGADGASAEGAGTDGASAEGAGTEGADGAGAGGSVA